MVTLNLADWIERRSDSLGGYGDHIVHSVRAYEAEIQRLRTTLSVISSRDCYSHDEVVSMARAALNKTDA